MGFYDRIRLAAKGENDAVKMEWVKKMKEKDTTGNKDLTIEDYEAAHKDKQEDPRLNTYYEIFNEDVTGGDENWELIFEAIKTRWNQFQGHLKDWIELAVNGDKLWIPEWDSDLHSEEKKVSGHIIRLKGHTRKVTPHKNDTADKKFTPRDSPYPDKEEETKWLETYGYYKRSSEARKVVGTSSNHDAQKDLAQWLLNFVPLGVHMKCYGEPREGNF